MSLDVKQSQAPQTPVIDPKAAPAIDTGAPAVATPEPPKEEPRASGKAFAALTRKEKSILERETKLKAEQESFKKEWNPKLESYKQYEERKVRAKTDRSLVLQALQEDYGLSYDELTQLVLNDNKPTAEMIAKQARDEAESIRREMRERDESTKLQAENAKKAQEEQAVTQFKNNIKSLLDQKGDDYEFTQSHPEGVDLVYAVIEEHYKTHGRVLDTDEAAKHVEAYLEKEIEEKVLARKKIQARLGQNRPSPAEGGGTEPGAGAGHPGGSRDPGMVQSGGKPLSPKTLTNAAQTSAPTPTTGRKLSPEESKAEAAKLLRWT